MHIMDHLMNQKLWKEYLAYKVEKGNLKKYQIEDLEKYIEEEEYVPIVEKIKETGRLSDPFLLEINKSGTTRKRIVYTFPREEKYVLKFMAYLLRKYDDIFAKNLYSFRSRSGVKKAIGQVKGKIKVGTTYAYKVDIHDYFNSVNQDDILAMFEKTLPEENRLYEFLRTMLRNPYAMKEGECITVEKGIMAGMPIAGFLANLYLNEMDYYFAQRNIPYIRYSDDIIVFSEEEEKIQEYEGVIKRFLAEKKLCVNEKKEHHFMPGDHIEFLGFEFSENCIDISKMSMQKLKGKMRRKARSLYRWKIRTGADSERTARAYIRFLNRKFYQNPIRNEITWARWYFPVITTSERLKEMDDYAVECIRYLYTGRHGKQNYNLRYDQIRKMGFQGLVNSYWKFKKNQSQIM